jgi:hypothetical protein
MDHARAVRYRKLALQEPDREKALLLQLIADESERGVLVTSEWLVPRPVLCEHQPQGASPLKDIPR